MVWGENNVVKVIKIPLGGFLNRNIHQGLVKLHWDVSVVSMYILFATMILRQIMDVYTKLAGLCCKEQVIGTCID